MFFPSTRWTRWCVKSKRSRGKCLLRRLLSNQTNKQKLEHKKENLLGFLPQTSHYCINLFITFQVFKVLSFELKWKFSNTIEFSKTLHGKSSNKFKQDNYFLLVLIARHQFANCLLQHSQSHCFYLPSQDVITTSFRGLLSQAQVFQALHCSERVLSLYFYHSVHCGSLIGHSSVGTRHIIFTFSALEWKSHLSAWYVIKWKQRVSMIRSSLEGYFESKQQKVVFLISRGEDGSRQIDDHLVMYNNPLFSKRNQPKRAASSRQLTVDSDWNVVFDLWGAYNCVLATTNLGDVFTLVAFKFPRGSYQPIVSWQKHSCLNSVSLRMNTIAIMLNQSDLEKI